MAVTRTGDIAPIFGLAAESFGYIQDFTVRQFPEKATVENHIGETKTALYWNRKFEGSFTIIESTGGNKPSLAGVNAVAAAIANLTEVSTAIIYEFERTPEQKGVQKTKYTFETWASLASL